MKNLKDRIDFRNVGLKPKLGALLPKFSDFIQNELFLKQF